MARLDGRAYDELRPLTITPDFTKYAEGSVLIEHGNTMVLYFKNATATFASFTAAPETVRF